MHESSLEAAKKCRRTVSSNLKYLRSLWDRLDRYWPTITKEYHKSELQNIINQNYSYAKVQLQIWIGYTLFGLTCNKYLLRETFLISIVFVTMRSIGLKGIEKKNNHKYQVENFPTSRWIQLLEQAIWTRYS